MATPRLDTGRWPPQTWWSMKRSPIRRRKPIKPINRARRDKARVKHWGPPGFVEYVKAMPCCACGRVGSTEAAHEPSRGAGGTWADIVPLCSGCHRTEPGAIHQQGRRTFEQSNGIDLEEAKARVFAGWQGPKP